MPTRPRATSARTLASLLLPFALMACETLEPPVLFTAHPSDVSASVGATATFSIAATNPGAYTVITWERDDGPGGDFEPIPGAPDGAVLTVGPVSLADDGARFRASVMPYDRSGGPLYDQAATSNAATLTVTESPCPVPPLPTFDRSSPPTDAPPVATLGANLVANPGFESGVLVGLQPTGFGYWRFDESASVPAQQGIEPRSGAAMLQFVGASRDVALFGGADSSEQIQVVDVSALQADIDADSVLLEASAWFARVAGCETTDDRFGLFAIAFDGGIDTYQAKWANGIAAATAQGVDRDVADMTGVDGWLLHRRITMRHDDSRDLETTASGDIFGWRELAIVANLPPGTTLVVVVPYAQENGANDTAFPEFHGHYADDVELRLTLRTP